jgi:outer membrane protein assembly factor BamB
MKTNTKIQTIVLAALLMITIGTSTILIPTANAHTPAWKIPTYAYLSVTPNPIGVGQQATIVMIVDKVLPGSAVDNDVRLKDYTLTVTKPDGTDQTLGTFQPESTGSTYTTYTPDKAGTYAFVFTHPDVLYTWTDPIPGTVGPPMPNLWTNDTYLGGTSNTVYLTVQEEPIPSLPSYPLPTEYWTRPIEGQNTGWWTISSNWLGGSWVTNYNVQPDGAAPNSPHIMWAKTLESGGVVGGTNHGVEGNTFYAGESYEMRFNDPLIINGVLYYDTPLSDNPTAGPYVAVDLRTGETLWQNNVISPFCGQLNTFDSPNQHGVIPNGYLYESIDEAFAGYSPSILPSIGLFPPTTTLRAYDPRTGNWLFNLTNVPGGVNYYGENGEILRYVLDNIGNRLAVWNSTIVLSGDPNLGGYRPVGQSLNASNAYSWNVSISTLSPTAAIKFVIPDDRILVTDGKYVSYLTGFGVTPLDNDFGTSDPFTFWAISIKPESRGQILWRKDYPAPPGNQSVLPVAHDVTNRVFIMYNKETKQFTGYSMDDGSLKWTTDYESKAFDYYMAGTMIAAAYNGLLYRASYGGVLYTFDTSNGKLLWTYGNGGEGNSTNSGLETAFGNYPLFISNIADGKIYLFTNEHSPGAPHYKGAKIRCVNATDGTEIWTMLSWVSSTLFTARGGVIADGYLAYYNAYDGRVYSIGKGPSAMTVTAPDIGVPYGKPVLVKGTVIDISAGTAQDEQAARFPNGVPAVSDESMGDWMEYVYMQKPKPTNVTGVEVVLTVLDPNNNYYEVGRTTGDADGFFKLSFVPEVPGEYTIIATFEGSESYWPSHAETALYVEEAPPATPEPTPVPQAPVETYFTVSTIAIIIAIAIAVLLILRKR